MKTVAIADGRATSRLGFGCALLSAGPSRGRSLRLLEAALEAGVTHFDVAPSYGMGLAEDVVGEFVQHRRGQVTVTTKVGLARPTSPRMLTAARHVLRPLLSLTPGLRRRLGGGIYRMTVARARFETQQVTASLAESLRRLRTDRVEFLLLHELTRDDVTDELRRFVEDARQKGMIGDYGIGSPPAAAERVAAIHPDLARVVQTSWSAGDKALAFAPGTFLLTHGSLRRLDQIAAWLGADRRRLQRLSTLVGEDLASPPKLADILLAAALARNADGIVVVATTRSGRTAQHAAVASDARLLEAGRKFAEALSEEMFETASKVEG